MSDKPAKAAMWGGRFEQDMDSRVASFNASISVDRELAEHDIRGSIAHATMLAEQGIISEDEADQIVDGLESIRADIRAGNFSWSEQLEDVHMNIEHALTERIGAAGGKLHTARSRNDQVATDFRLWVREQTGALIVGLDQLRHALLGLAEANADVIMPGYTHLQVAQPVLFAHHLLAYFEMFGRDEQRFRDSLARTNISPLGAGALAGTGFPIDRERTAALLGFDAPAANSLDAVSDRDFALEFLANCSIAMMHLSRMSEELILWSSQEFGFIQLPDSHTTGSSIMPQKKNADVSELIRGKTGRVYGSLMGLLTVMKGLPLTYNKDMQEDKEGVFDAGRTLQVCLQLSSDMLPLLTVNRERMYFAAGRAYSNATDLADYLAKKGLPFRSAHEVTGRLVALGIREGRDLQELSLFELQQVSNLIEEDVFDVLKLENVVNARNSYGGTGSAQVAAQLRRARLQLDPED